MEVETKTSDRGRIDKLNARVNTLVERLDETYRESREVLMLLQNTMWDLTIALGKSVVDKNND